MSEPSVLTYARYFELTQDYSLHDPLEVLDGLSAQPKCATNLQNFDENVETLVRGFEKAARDYVTLANNDSLPISQDVASYLEEYTNHRIRDITELYNDLLPDPYRIRKLKLDLPLLILGGGDVERDAKKIRKGIDLQAVIEDILEEIDERNHRQNRKPPPSSAVSAEILEWSRTQFEAAMKKDKLEVNMATMKYMRETLSFTVEPAEIATILFDSMPRITNHDRIDVCSLTEEDFEFEVDANVLEFPDILEAEEIDDEELPLPIKRELDMLGRLDAAVDEEFLQSTQVEREMDELFRQFTHHDSDDQDKIVFSDPSSEYFEDSPPAKRRKLVHGTGDKIMPRDIGGNDIQGLNTGSGVMKIRLPAVSSRLFFRLPPLDLPVMLNQGDESESFENKISDTGLPPFHIPTIHEALHESMPTQTKVAEKFIVDEKAIISSDMLLWKEPGIRILDIDDAQDENILVDNFEIEEREPDTFTSISPDCKRGATTADVFGNSGHRDDTKTKSYNPRKDKVKTVPVMIKSEPVDSVYLKREFRLDDINTSIIRSTPVLINPFTRNQACSPSSLEGVFANAVEDRLFEPIKKVQKSPALSKLSNEFTDGKSMIASYEAGLKSLLPQTKRRQPAQQIGSRNESILNDSLSSFLDLRGKQFKLPVVNRVCEAEVADDPISSTQDSIMEEWFSDEHTLTLTPSPTQPTQSAQQETVPSITLLGEPRTIIVNSALLQAKPLLVQFLESTDTTNLTLIYRDIDAKQVQGPDLILNTTSCLFVTNLQSLNQRPLPGQNSITGLSSAHDRAASLANSYSQVIILVHHPTSTDSAAQSKTISTQASFAAFCQDIVTGSRLGARKVQPYWLPCVNPASTTDIVNAWVWQVISCCAYRNRSSKSPRPGLTHPTLIEEETLWELFLRKAGLNPLAAQVVISSLKKPSVQNRVNTGLEVIWGLRRLVAMSSSERMKMFGDMIGADVVERLNKVLSDRDSPEYGT